MSRCVVVLGMHRSGTSCVTRMLHHLGVYLGENLDDEPAPTNLTGHWEGRDTIAINDAILNQSGGSWHDVPDQLTWDAECDTRISQAVAQLASRPVYGWKDPRTTITFPAWKPHLPDRAIVACIRHPRAVAESLALRDGFTIERGLELWTAYNEHLLRHLDHERVYWFTYDEPAELCEAQLRRLCVHLDLTFRPDVMSLFNPYLRHFQAGEGTTDGKAIELYETLVAKARHESGDESPVAAAPEAESSCGEELAPSAGASLISREHNLQEVLRNFGIAQQRYWRAVSDLQRLTADNLSRSTEERLAEGLERAKIDTERVSALELRLPQEIQNVTAAAAQQAVAAHESLRQVAEQWRVDREQDRQQIAVLEARLAMAEEQLPHNLMRRWLRRVPGLRPVYHLARRAMYVGG